MNFWYVFFAYQELGGALMFFNPESSFADRLTAVKAFSRAVGQVSKCSLGTQVTVHMKRDSCTFCPPDDEIFLSARSSLPMSLQIFDFEKGTLAEIPFWSPRSGLADPSIKKSILPVLEGALKILNQTAAKIPARDMVLT